MNTGIAVIIGWVAGIVLTSIFFQKWADKQVETMHKLEETVKNLKFFVDSHRNGIIDSNNGIRDIVTNNIIKQYTKQSAENNEKLFREFTAQYNKQHEHIFDSIQFHADKHAKLCEFLGVEWQSLPPREGYFKKGK